MSNFHKTLVQVTLVKRTLTVCYIYRLCRFLFTNGKKSQLLCIEKEMIKHKEADGALKLKVVENMMLQNMVKVLETGARKMFFLSLNSRQRR